MTKYILMALALGAFTGCDNGDTLTEPQAMQAINALVSGSGSGFSAVDGQVEQGANGQITVNATAPCLTSGSVTADGRVTANSTTEEFSYNFGLAFASCQVGTITMNGNISVAGSVSPGQLSLSLDGRVTFSGDLSGTCVFDLNQSLNSSTGSATISGRACGRRINIQANQGQ